jgi:protoheme IX farnesyltransferase
VKSGGGGGAWRLALLTLGTTFVLLLVGGTVNPSGSSLACPDWPTCYGSFFPEMKGGVRFEHTHRIVATLVGLLTIGLAVLAWRGRRGLGPVVPKLALAAVGLVVAQGVLGGVTVLLRLPMMVSTTHLATAMGFFALLIYLAFRLRPGVEAQIASGGPSAARTSSGTPATLARARALAGLAALAVYGQIVLGAFVRHTLSGRACLDVPFCDGDPFPAAGPAALHMLHRWAGVAVFALVIAVGFVGARDLRRAQAEPGGPLAAGPRPLARIALLLAPTVALLQVLLGAWMVVAEIHWIPASLHTAMAALLLGLLQAAFHALGPLGRPGNEPVAPAAAAPGRPSFARDLLTLTKPSITAMNVLAALGGLALAPGEVPWYRAALAILGTSLAVASANALNMVWERDGDRLMARTASRPLPQGRLTPELATSFGLLLGALSFAHLLLVNTLTAALGLFALLSYVLVYTPLKRRTPLALLVGAVPGAMPPLMGWTAATGTVDLPGLVLFGILLIWQLPHFLAIALYRKDDYARAGIRTVPVVRGDAVARAQAIAWTTALLPVSLLLVPLHVASWLYAGAALGLGLWFLVWSLRGLRPGAGIPWARRFFFASLVYLPALTLALALDVALLG